MRKRFVELLRLKCRPFTIYFDCDAFSAVSMSLSVGQTHSGSPSQEKKVRGLQGSAEDFCTFSQKMIALSHLDYDENRQI